MSFMEIANRIASGGDVRQHIEEELNRVYQAGLSEGFERGRQVNPEQLGEVVKHLMARNAELHADKHELRMRTCHRCGAYPEIP